MKPLFVNEDEIEKIKKMVECGLSVREIARRFDSTPYYVDRVIKEYNIEREFTCRSVCKPKRDKIVRLRKLKLPISEIAEHVGCSEMYAFKILKETEKTNGEVIPSSIRNLKHLNLYALLIWDALRKRGSYEKVLRAKDLFAISVTPAMVKNKGLKHVRLYRHKSLFNIPSLQGGLYYVSSRELVNYLVFKCAMKNEKSQWQKLAAILKNSLTKYQRDLFYKKLGRKLAWEVPA